MKNIKFLQEGNLQFGEELGPSLPIEGRRAVWPKFLGFWRILQVWKVRSALFI